MLELRNICYEVDEDGKKKSILKDVCLTFKDGEIVVITGHNGSGKSTLVKIIMGILKPTGGEVWFDGKNITNLCVTDRANLGIAYAFQTPVVFKGITVKDLLDSASRGKNTLDDACENLSRVGLCARDYIERGVDAKLSGGELKRIELASALARRAKLNIFDEPEAGIDLWSFDALTNLFKTNNTALNIIISHQKRILEIADKIAVLNNASVERFGEGKKILAEISDENRGCERLNRLA